MGIESRHFDSGVPGKRLLVFGAIHGDEVCGPAGIRRIVDELTSRTLVLRSGSVTLVPVANPDAYERGERQIEADLNRVFKKTDNPDSYEARLANELIQLADQSDVLLDLHSSSAPGPVNAFLDYPSADMEAFMLSLQPGTIIYDWPKVYEQRPDLASFTTERYMHDRGASATTFECGQHQDATAPDVAYTTIRRALAHLGITNGDSLSKEGSKTRKVWMREVVTFDQEGDAFLGSWKHLEHIPKGTAIAKRADGTVIEAGEGCVIIFPYPKAEPGDEWFYLGELER